MDLSANFKVSVGSPFIPNKLILNQMNLWVHQSTPKVKLSSGVCLLDLSGYHSFDHHFDIFSSDQVSRSIYLLSGKPVVYGGITKSTKNYWW